MKHIGEAQRRTAEMKQKYGNCKGMANGGRIKAYPDMKAGSASGVGRIEKTEKYGKKSREDD